MNIRSICLGLSVLALAGPAGAADGLHAQPADAVWPQWQVRIGLQTGNAPPLSLSTAFGNTRLGLGQARAAWQNGLALTADLGLVTDRLGSMNGRTAFGLDGTESGPRDAHPSPLLQLGVRYSF